MNSPVDVTRGSYEGDPPTPESQSLSGYQLNQDLFVSNLPEGLMPTALSNGSITEIIQVEDSVDVLRLNRAVSKLCQLPSGKKLVEKLIETARKNSFVITFSAGDELGAQRPQISEVSSQLQLPIDINFQPYEDHPDQKTFARLTLQGQHYGIEPIVYPDFIMLAHEMTHALHHIRAYADLVKCLEPEAVPALNASEEDWSRCAKKVCKKFECDYLHKENKTRGEYQLLCYRLLARNEIIKRFGLDLQAGLSEAEREIRQEAIAFWDDNHEEESLTILGDGTFSDRIFLEEARDASLLQGVSEGSIVRWGHGNYEHAATLKDTLEQEQFDAVVKKFSAVLPYDLDLRVKWPLRDSTWWPV